MFFHDKSTLKIALLVSLFVLFALIFLSGKNTPSVLAAPLPAHTATATPTPTPSPDPTATSASTSRMQKFINWAIAHPEWALAALTTLLLAAEYIFLWGYLSHFMGWSAAVFYVARISPWAALLLGISISILSVVPFSRIIFQMISRIIFRTEKAKPQKIFNDIFQQILFIISMLGGVIYLLISDLPEFLVVVSLVVSLGIVTWTIFFTGITTAKLLYFITPPAQIFFRPPRQQQQQQQWKFIADLGDMLLFQRHEDNQDSQNDADNQNNQPANDAQQAQEQTRTYRFLLQPKANIEKIEILRPHPNNNDNNNNNNDNDNNNA